MATRKRKRELQRILRESLIDHDLMKPILDCGNEEYFIRRSIEILYDILRGGELTDLRMVLTLLTYALQRGEHARTARSKNPVGDSQEAHATRLDGQENPR